MLSVIFAITGCINEIWAILGYLPYGVYMSTLLFIWRLKPATNLAILYADRGEFDRQRKIAASATINIENKAHLAADTRHAGYPRYRTRLAAIGENRNRCTGHTRQFSPIAAIGVKNRQVCRRLVAGDTQSDFIRRSPRLAKIARCARCSDCDFRQTPRSAYKIYLACLVSAIKIAGIRQVSPFPRFSTLIAANRQ